MNKILVLPFVYLLIMFSGCAVSHPEPVAIPLFSKKHEFQAAAGGSLSSNLNASVAYAVTKNICTQVYGSFEKYGNKYLQGTAGYYLHSPKKLHIEAFVGYGSGYGFAETDYNGHFFEGTYNSYFVQLTTANPKKDDWFKPNVGASFKAGIFDSRFQEGNLDTKSRGDYERQKRFFTEPHFFVRTGSKKIRFNATVGLCFMQMTGKEFYPNSRQVIKASDLPYGRINAGVNLIYILPGK